MADADTPDEGEGAASPTVDWRQCGLCTPSDPTVLPGHLSYDPGKELLLIATQTCSLVGMGAEPAFEVAVAAPLENFDADSPQARGKLIRYLHLPLEDGCPACGIELDISRRAILPSENLRAMTPAPCRVPEASLKAFQGWIARHYARIALPDELDRRLRKRQFHRKFEKALGQILLDRTTPYKVHTDIDRIYVQWEPDAELPHDKNYAVRVLVTCRRPGTVDHLLRALSGLATGVKGAPLLNGLLMDDPDVQLASEVRLADVSGMRVFTAFDEFSALAEVARALGGDGTR